MKETENEEFGDGIVKYFYIKKMIQAELQFRIYIAKLKKTPHVKGC